MSVRTFYAALGVDLPDRAGELPVRCFTNPDAHRHDDRDPSASVNADTGCYFCHGCGSGGGPYDVAVAHRVAPADAMAMLEKHGLKERDEPRGPGAAPGRQRRTSGWLPESADNAERFHAALVGNEGALRRLEELRGWTPATVKRLGLGLDGDRIVLPARDAEGQLVGLLRYAPDPERRNGKKMLAEKGMARELFPAPESLEAETVWLVEGEPDAVSGHELGLAAVGVPGTGKWSPGWGERFADRDVVVVFDCDEAGRRAVARAAEALAPHAARVRVVDLDRSRNDGYDLGDLVREAAANGGVRHAARLVRRVAEWAEPVGTSVGEDVGELLDAHVAVVRRYVVMTPAQADAVALWVLHTHALEAAETTPYMAVTSAEKRSGKSRLLEVLVLLVSRPLPTANVSDAALFRSVADGPPTLLFDEVDAIFGPKARDREDLRSLLNAGYRRGAEVLRCVGDGSKQRVERFPVFCAKALAGIGELPDTVADRSLPIRLQRRAPDEQVERFRRREAEPEAAALRERAELFAAAVLPALADARPDLPDELDDRGQDVVEPLLAIADLAGGEWPERARRALVELRADRQLEDDSPRVRLLADARHVFAERSRLSSAELLEGLAALDEAPWADWYGKQLTNRALAKLLKPYGIRSRTVRLDDGSTPKGFVRDQFEGAWKRYLPPAARSIRHTATTRTTSGVEPNPHLPQSPDVADTNTAAKRHHEPDVADVADSSGMRRDE